MKMTTKTKRYASSAALLLAGALALTACTTTADEEVPVSTPETSPSSSPTETTPVDPGTPSASASPETPVEAPAPVSVIDVPDTNPEPGEGVMAFPEDRGGAEVIERTPADFAYEPEDDIFHETFETYAMTTIYPDWYRTVEVCPPAPEDLMFSMQIVEVSYPLDMTWEAVESAYRADPNAARADGVRARTLCLYTEGLNNN